ncbi:protein FAR-RED IMPAIRED RESPONSE 1-like [Diospyros lotus]|uniref:protein FAR-RED IMPAIRED RESPONSE 1-like n=1 Tax=Diospyros lotus TaxID=55363 RepID=UPI00225B0C11|nr:protein FAR-RED IMPAIRED RESPONSE 1-like [Diospyros lotus]
MVSTQRSEGMHAFFDGYVHSMSTFKQFVEQYEIAMSTKIQKEFLADYDSKYKVIKCISEFDWEIQFQQAYTNSMFKLVQNEIRRLLYCHVIPLTEEEAGAAATMGIPCCHIFKLMSFKDMKVINERYILRRWRKDVVRRHSEIFFAGGYPHMTDEFKKFKEVECYFQECTNMAFGSREKMEFIQRRLAALKNDLINWNDTMAINESITINTEQDGD